MPSRDVPGDAAPDVLISGETLVDFLPDRPGPLADVEGFTRRAGGAPANVAVGLARLGAAPHLLTRVGADPFGDFLVATLDANGVPDRFVQRDPDRRTALAFVGHDPDADREFTFYRNDTADCHLDADAVPDRVLASVELVCVGGVMLAAEPGRSTTFDLVGRARERDCTVVFDPNARPELWGDEADRRRTTERLLVEADVVRATPDDLAETRFGADDPGAVAAALAAADPGPHTALVTAGARGAVAAATAAAPWGTGEASHGGYDVEVVDATGAGDAFLAGALAALAGGEGLSETLAFANAVAALATTGTGAMRSLPDRGTVRAFRAARDGGA